MAIISLMESSMFPTLLILVQVIMLRLTTTTAHDQKAFGSGTTAVQQDWATRHMAEEHHIGNYDPGAFFTLHDYDNNGYWAPEEILRTYGLEDESTKDVSAEKRKDVVREVLRLVDSDHDGLINRPEWMMFNANGGRLPDFGLGPGHHGDDEYEYEIHHFEKYHDADTKEEDLTHPEDIAHFKKHDKETDEENEQLKLDAMSIVERNIPAKFRRNP